MGIFKKLFGGIARSISNIFSKELDDEFYEDLTAVLLTADMGSEATERIIEDIKKVAKRQGIKTEEELKKALANSISEILSCGKANGGLRSEQQQIIMVVGVNGVGKTTSIAKLANLFKKQHKSVLVAAADTFRAAATEQLDIWANRAGIRIVKQDQGADPASVVFDALTSAKAKHDDIVIIDTAGRLHNKGHLIEELKKIDRVVGKFVIKDGTQGGLTGGNAPYKKYIVLDATTGQNALNQVEVFNEAITLDGVILTKLDGTAKGGVVVAIKEQFNLPVVYVGIGEKLDDLIEFDPLDFAKGIVGIE